MNRNDVIGLIGLILLVVGFGGGFGLMFLTQGRAYEAVILAEGNASPELLVSAMRRSKLYVQVGIPIGLSGIVCIAMAARGYLLSISQR